ncbi:hypothetical protein ACCT18_05265 [Rhizobium ruizarguesonis]
MPVKLTPLEPPRELTVWTMKIAGKRKARIAFVTGFDVRQALVKVNHFIIRHSELPNRIAQRKICHHFLPLFAGNDRDGETQQPLP